MNGDEIVFSGAMSQLEIDRWIQNMEDHMENNPIVGKDMTQHALQCFERGVATWWRMYQTINGWQGVTTWKEFKLTLPKFRLVSQKLKPYGNDMKKPCAYKLYGEIGHNHKENKEEYPHKRRITKGVSRGFSGNSGWRLFPKVLLQQWKFSLHCWERSVKLRRMTKRLLR